MHLIFPVFGFCSSLGTHSGSAGVLASLANLAKKFYNLMGDLFLWPFVTCLALTILCFCSIIRNGCSIFSSLFHSEQNDMSFAGTCCFYTQALFHQSGQEHVD